MERKLSALETMLCSHSTMNKNKNNLNQSNTSVMAQNMQKFQMILDLLERILTGLQRVETRSRALSCNKTKIKELICCYGPCAEFIILCGFVFVSHGGKNGDDVYSWAKGGIHIAQIGLDVVKRKKNEIKEKKIKHQKKGSQHTKSNSSSKSRRWCCKECDTLNNKKHSRCWHCKTKRKLT